MRMDKLKKRITRNHCFSLVTTDSPKMDSDNWHNRKIIRRYHTTQRLSPSSLRDNQKQHHHIHQMLKSKMKTLALAMAAIAVAFTQISAIARAQSSGQRPLVRDTGSDPFPGVSRDLASFCAARPSLPIDVASMVVHVKRNVSFNYKLYLFSADHVFQTGQVIPRDEFRIHSFPVKFKRLNEFWPQKVNTFQYNDSRLNSIRRVPSETFNLKQFLKSVPLNPTTSHFKSNIDDSPQVEPKSKSLLRQQDSRISNYRPLPEDLHGDSLPGDPPAPSEFISHDVARVMEHRELQQQQQHRKRPHVDNVHPYNENYNKDIKFDRDDQLSVTKNINSVLEGAATSGSASSAPTTSGHQSSFGDEIIPVGAFSSFHVNLTYFVRKDFGQLEPELIRVHIDAGQFVVSELVLINGHRMTNSSRNQSTPDYPLNEDYSFLQHRLIRDPNTRITAINQIYEDWITRNFYTIVYIQRKLSTDSREDEVYPGKQQQQQVMIVNDRLVFRGTSTALLGAEQLDYSVKAAAFITEKNGLHYYLEFLTTGKFYLCAVDWTKRPFKMIDSRGFPIKATKTQLDNEELLLCPPSVCYSSRPVDEIVGYGRMLSLNDDNEINSNYNYLITEHPAKSSATINDGNRKALIRSTNVRNSTHLGHPHGLAATLNLNSKLRNNTNHLAGNDDNDGLRRWRRQAEVERFKLGSRQLETRLHLRDWVWTLPRKLTQMNHQQPVASGLSLINLAGPASNSVANGTGGSRTSFEWHYERAKRNDIKVKQDTYGYVLTGHEIDASYRVQNELYLISANHLITINYTLINETVTSNQLLGDEFSGLSSTILDPITGAFYDRYENQVFFFKGDRYIGYNYTTKRPLDDFVLESPLSSMELDPIGINLFNSGPLVSTLPVVGILGRQHEVDGVYHDYSSDFVYIFSGMKFYKLLAGNFKNGTFFRPDVDGGLPPMQCINEHFLDGCHFDRAFPNPCVSDTTTSETGTGTKADVELLHNSGDQHEPDADHHRSPHDDDGGNRHDGGRPRGPKVAGGNFFEQQQMKLRSIAARKPGGFMNIFKENSLLKGPGGAPLQAPNDNDAIATPEEDGLAEVGEPEQAPTKKQQDSTSRSHEQETLFVYLLITMIVLTCLISILLILMLIYWSSRAKPGPGSRSQVPNQQHPFSAASYLAGSNYLSNQSEHQSRQALGSMAGAVAAAAAAANSQQLAYGGRLIVPKQLSGSCVKVVNGSGQETTRSNSIHSDSNSIDNSAL